MKISVLTLGCKVNQAESFQIENALRDRGHRLVDLAEKPDICIVNTCTVTSKSDYQSRQLIRRANRVGARVIVTGCYSELNKQQVMSMDGVSDLVENNKKLEIVNRLTDENADSFTFLPSGGRSRLFVKIQDGCDYSCSYCTIPKARGISRSLAPEIVINEVNKAVSFGYNEIVLTGIHLGTYGLDLKPKVKLSDLTRTILIKTKINRIRLSSLEIREISDDLLELLNDRRICNHLHIPLQSGDNKILKLMQRTYNAKEFSLKIEHIYRKTSEIAIGTDIIVGFPEEGESEFRNTYNLIESLPLSYMHIFPFSPRPGTIAHEMQDNTPVFVKKERVGLLEGLNIRKKEEFMLKQVGKSLDILIEEDNSDSTCTGTAGNYLKVLLASNNHPRKSIIQARIDRIEKGRLVGIPI